MSKHLLFCDSVKHWKKGWKDKNGSLIFRIEREYDYPYYHEDIATIFGFAVS